MRLRSTLAMGATLALLAGCGGTAPVPASAPPPLSSAEATTPSAALEASATPAPTPEPTPDPTPTAQPVFEPWTVPDGRSAQVMAVGTDGTLYATTFEVDPNGQATDGQLVALGADGAPRSDWHGPTAPAGSVVLDAVAGPDGGLYVAIGPSPGADGGSTSLFLLANDGASRPGWPVTIPVQGIRSRLQVSGDALAFLWSEDAMTRFTLERIDPGGSRAEGWPVTIGGSRVLLSRAGGDGTLYVDVPPPNDPLGATRVLAYGTNGQPVPGWQPLKSKAQHHVAVLPLDASLLAFTYSMGFGEPDGFTWHAPDGTPTGATAKGPRNMGSPTLDVGPDDVAYVGYYSVRDGGMTGPGRVLALGIDGKERPGWPLALDGWPASVTVGPDGTVWVLEVLGPDANRVSAYGTDGKPLLPAPVSTGGDPFSAAVAGPDGTLFTTDRTSGTTRVIAVSLGG